MTMMAKQAAQDSGLWTAEHFKNAFPLDIKLSEKHIETLKKAFDIYQTDGKIRFHDLYGRLCEIGIEKRQPLITSVLKAMYDEIGIDAHIDFDTFMT